MDKPLRYCYLADERLWAGEYPGCLPPESAYAKVRSLTDFGIDTFIDLTESDELIPYAQYLPGDVAHERFGIRDLYTPETPKDMDRILDRIHELLQQGKTVYVHCLGGIGRTGTVVACYYIRFHHLDAEAALARLAVKFADDPKSEYRKSPQTPRQFDFIRRYADSGTDSIKPCTGST